MATYEATLLFRGLCSELELNIRSVGLTKILGVSRNGTRHDGSKFGKGAADPETLSTKPSCTLTITPTPYLDHTVDQCFGERHD